MVWEEILEQGQWEDIWWDSIDSSCIGKKGWGCEEGTWEYILIVHQIVWLYTLHPRDQTSYSNPREKSQQSSTRLPQNLAQSEKHFNTFL